MTSFIIDVGSDHYRTLARQQFCARRADSGGGASHQRDLALNLSHRLASV
jgi:hypothetical protein